jgi:hypothetical protein
LSRAIKVTVPTADIGSMISVSCRSCGSDLEDPRDAVCMHCGMPIGGRRPPELPAQTPPRKAVEASSESPPADGGERPAGPPLSPASMWKLGIWAALLVSVVAVGAILATLITAATHTPEIAQGTASAAADATGAPAGADESDHAAISPLMPDLDPPLAGAVTIDHPALNTVVRQNTGTGVVAFRIDGSHCGRGEGKIVASGVITNYSMARQRFDYTITVDLIRSWNRSVIGTLETTVTDLGPLESAEWSVEMVSSRVSTLDCDVTAVGATPVG